MQWPLGFKYNYLIHKYKNMSSSLPGRVQNCSNEAVKIPVTKFEAYKLSWFVSVKLKPSPPTQKKIWKKFVPFSSLTTIKHKNIVFGVTVCRHILLPLSPFNRSEDDDRETLIVIQFLCSWSLMTTYSAGPAAP